MPKAKKCQKAQKGNFFLLSRLARAEKGGAYYDC
jgi:hypothetical protein